MKSYKYVTYETLDDPSVEGGIVIVTLNRPDKLNAVNAEMAAELADAFHRFSAEDEFVAIVTGAGRAFSAGADVKENVNAGRTSIHNPLIGDRYNPFFPGEKTGHDGPAVMAGHVRHLSKIVIAAVNGYALGSGFFMSLAADLCIASEAASFELTEVPLGMPVGWDVGFLHGMPRHVAMELALGGRISAHRAADIGLINQVVPADDLLPTAIAWARRLCSLPHAALVANRELVDRLQPSIPLDVKQAAADHRERIYGAADSGERLRRFVQSRSREES